MLFQKRLLVARMFSKVAVTLSPTPPPALPAVGLSYSPTETCGSVFLLLNPMWAYGYSGRDPK